MPWVSEENHAQDVQALRELRSEVRDFKEMQRKATLLVAGAMRQGYVNKTQKEALTYAMVALTGETDEWMIHLMIEVKPRGFGNTIIERHDPDKEWR